MADWKKLLKDVLLADGTIDVAETELLKKELLADATIDDEEIEFLVGLRNDAKSVGQDFEEFFFLALKKNILADGEVDAEEVKRLRELIFADGTVDASEKKFLQDIKKEAKKTAPEFDALIAECIK